MHPKSHPAIISKGHTNAIPMTKLSERQQLCLLLQTTAPTTTTALETPISPTSYLTWSKSRRRAWDRRYASPNNYFFHYLHPSFTPRPSKWSLAEHQIFLAALKIAPPNDQWGKFSLLLPGRVGSECRRYYHRIGRAGFITLDGKARNKLFSKARIHHDDTALQSANPIFLKRSLNKFIPTSLPSIDDNLYKSLATRSKPAKSRHPNDSGKRKTAIRNIHEGTSVSREKSEKEKFPSRPNPVLAQDLLTYIPPRPSEYDGNLSERNPNPSPPNTTSETHVLCRLRVRDSNQATKSSVSPKSGIISNHNTPRVSKNPVKIVSAKAQHTKATSASSARDSRSAKARQKRKESGKSKGSSKSDKKTMKSAKKGEKENDAPSRSHSSCGVEIQPNPLKKAGRGKAIRESRKHDEPNIGKQSGTVGDPPHVDCSLASEQATTLKEKPVKPLKPILKTKGSADLQRQNAKTVHFCSTESPPKASPAQKDLVPNEDAIPTKNSSVVPPLLVRQEAAIAFENHAPTDKKLPDQHAIDPSLKIDRTDDVSRRMHESLGILASEYAPLAGYDSATLNHAIHQVAAASSLLESSSLEHGGSGQLSGEESVLVENNSTSSHVFPQDPQTPSLRERTPKSNLGCADLPLETELDISLKSGQECGSMPSTWKTTHEPLHVGCYAENSEKHSFKDKAQNHVETTHLEHSTSVAESYSTGTDGEFLDLEVEMGAPPGNQQERPQSLEKSETGSKLRNSRRITGPTSGDRTSISFLMNGEDAEPQQKKRRLGTDEASVHGSVLLVTSDHDVTTTIQEAEHEDAQETEAIFAVRNDAPPKEQSEYQVMQTRVEQTRLLLSLFVDMIDPIGEQLGHKHQRLKLLENFDESLRWLQFTEGYAAKKRPLRIPSFLEVARTAVELDSRSAGKQCTVHVGGLTRYWGAFVDSYIDRLKDMEARQNMEVQSKQIADSVF